MNILDMVKRLEDDIFKCVKCGLCRSVCPVFLELGQESSVARGKIALIEALSEGRLSTTSTLTEKIQCCLLCGTCVENCPSSVRVDYIIYSARSIATKTRGLSFSKWLILKLFLRNRRLFSLGFKISSAIQKILFHPTGFYHTRKSRFNIGLDKRRVVLPIASKALRDRWPETSSPANPGKRVALFTGCTMNHVLTKMGDAVIEVLMHHGVEVIIPKDQSCCGIVAMAAGDQVTFRTLARNNIKLLSELDVDAIIVACATCRHSLKHQYLTLLYSNSGKFHDMAKKVAGMTYDICEYLTTIISAKKASFKETESSDNEIAVTCHDPCHLRGDKGVHNKQRELINLIAGVRIKEMSSSERCCGGGGVFSLSYYDISLRILNKKIDDIEETGASIVLTSCAGCHMQLVDGLVQRSSPIKVMHPVELYYKAQRNTYQPPPRESPPQGL